MIATPRTQTSTLSSPEWKSCGHNTDLSSTAVRVRIPTLARTAKLSPHPFFSWNGAAERPGPLVAFIVRHAENASTRVLKTACKGCFPTDS